MSMDLLVKYGESLVGEQDNVKRVQLAEQYLAGASLAGSDGSSVPETYDGNKSATPQNVRRKLWKPKATRPTAGR